MPLICAPACSHWSKHTWQLANCCSVVVQQYKLELRKTHLKGPKHQYWILWRPAVCQMRYWCNSLPAKLAKNTSAGQTLILSSSVTSKHACWTNPDSLLCDRVFIEFDATVIPTVSWRLLVGFKSPLWVRTAMDQTDKVKHFFQLQYKIFVYERDTIFDTESLSRWYSDITMIGSVPQGRYIAPTFYPRLPNDKANSSAITDCFLPQLTAAFHHRSSFLHNCDQLSCRTKWRAFFFLFFLSHQKAVVEA